MPSRPAIIIAAKARYGLHDGSGKRTSMRRWPCGELPAYTGMRIDAERLRARVRQVHRRLVAGDEAAVAVRRRVGERGERLACLRMPPM